MSDDFWNRPCADKSLRSYRYRLPNGWVMVGACDDVEALTEARRSTDKAGVLEVWHGAGYVVVEGGSDAQR